MILILRALKIKYLRLQKLILKLSALILVPICTLGLFYFLEQQGFFEIQNVDIQVNMDPKQQILIHRDLENIQKELSAFKKQSLIDVRLKDIQLDLKTYPWIETFRVSKVWPTGLRLEIVPYDIPLLIQSSAKYFAPVTETGEVLNQIPITEAPDVILAPQKIFLTDKEKRMKTLRFIQDMPEKGHLSRATVSSIELSEKNGFELRLIQPSLKVILGDVDLPDKTDRVSQILDYIEKNQLQPKLIDAASGKKIIVRLREGSTTEIIK